MPVLIALRRMRSRHLDLVRESKELLAHVKHPVDHILRKAGVDEVGESDISARSVELLPDALGVLYVQLAYYDSKDEVDLRDLYRLRSPQSQ
jgi:hypothetical protein